MSSEHLGQRDPYLSDDELVELAAHGDVQARAELYDRHGTVVYGLALAVLHDRSRAEDVVEDGFHAIWSTIREVVPGEGKVRARLLILVHRRAVARVRATSVPESALRTALFPERVASLLAELPLPEREAVERAYFGGQTTSELAETAGVRRTVVRKAMLAGLQRLSQALDEYIPDVGVSTPRRAHVFSAVKIVEPTRTSVAPSSAATR